MPELAIPEAPTFFNYNAVTDRPTRAFLRSEETAIKSAIKRTQNDIIEIGNRLHNVKERVGHGMFIDWIEGCFGLSHQTANNFMNVAERFGKFPNFGNLTFQNSALYALAAPSVSDEVRDEAIALAASGVTVTNTTAKALIAANQAPATQGATTSTAAVPATSSDTTVAENDDKADEDEPDAPSGVNTTGAEPAAPADTTTGQGSAAAPAPTSEAQTPSKSTDTKVPASGQTLTQRAKSAEVVHDTLGNAPKAEEPDDSDLTPDEWLKTIPVYRVLSGLQGKGIIAKRSLLDYRAIAKAAGTFQHHTARCETVKHPDDTQLSTILLGIGKLSHPRDWGICGPCRGNGCTKCGNAGYDLNGAGIDARRIESGEVAL